MLGAVETSQETEVDTSFGHFRKPGDLGLTADIGDHCKLVLQFPEGTNSSWDNARFKIFEPLNTNAMSVKQSFCGNSTTI